MDRVHSLLHWPNRELSTTREIEFRDSPLLFRQHWNKKKKEKQKNM